ncbi:MAG: hypothetical protein IK082_05000 [Oscillospiraceae bacterium]|nr:hypothetical protein [Oscillospiraceae bacterium]
MAQNISLLGADYSAVPSVLLPKIGGGTASFTDVTDTTAAAADVAAGKYFYTASGVRTLGTGSGGGGGGSLTQDANGYLVVPTTGGGGGGGSTGLEYEEGTYTPTTDTARPTITFTNTHTTPPMFVMMADATGTDDTTTPTNLAVSYASFYEFTGYGVPSNISDNRRYALADYVYRTSTNPSQAATGITALTGSSSSNVGYWVSTTGFYPSTASDTRYWRANRTYKWIAIWAPTT